MRLRTVTTLAALTIAALLSGCGAESANYQQRMDYLRKVAQRGAETHALIASQEAATDKPRCERAFGGLNTDDAPDVYTASGGLYQPWLDQIKEFFVDSCVSGKPKPVPGDPILPPAPSSSAPESAAPTVSASR
jgi:hypothetical protein